MICAVGRRYNDPKARLGTLRRQTNFEFITFTRAIATISWKIILVFQLEGIIYIILKMIKCVNV